MRRTGLSMMLLGALLAAALGPAAGVASGDVLFEQAVGPSGVAVPSQEVVGGGAGSTYVADDFVVPKGSHWRPTALLVYGTSPIQRGRTFRVRIWPESGAPYPADEDDIFEERVPAAGGPNYLIPLEGVPQLEPGSYWIQARAITAGGEDTWNWLTGPNAAGTYPAVFASNQQEPEGAEPGQAFQLLGSQVQILRATSFWGLGTIGSQPAGLSCSIYCEAEFPHGTAVTLTAAPLTPAVEFTGWKSGSSLPTPCTAAGPCTFSLDQDTSLQATFAYVDKVSVLRAVRDRRTGRGQLLVWLPGEGVLKMESLGLKGYRSSGPLPAGLLRIPLIPRDAVTKRLRQKGRAKVSVSVTFRPTKSTSAGTVTKPITLVRKRAGKPAHRLH